MGGRNPSHGKGKGRVEDDALTANDQDANATTDTFNSEVTAKAGVMVDIGGTKRVYCAVKAPRQICPTCHPGGQQKGKICKPGQKYKCFAQQCSRCKFYGHVESVCKQAQDVHGNQLTA